MSNRIPTMEHKGSLLTQQRGFAMFSVIGVHLLLLLSTGLAQTSTQPAESGRDLANQTTVTSSPSSISATASGSPSSQSNSTSAPASFSPSSSSSSFSSSPSPQPSSAPSTVVNLSSTQVSNGTTQSPNTSVVLEPLVTQGPEANGTSLSSTSLAFADTNLTTSAPGSNMPVQLGTTLSFSASTSNDTSPSQGSFHSTSVMANHTTDRYNLSMTTKYVSWGNIDSTSLHPSTTEGPFDESLIRLLIIAGATAGSCLVLLILVFVLVFCCHKRRQKRRNARYYEFKKKNYNSKYERVEQKNSLARKGQPENTPIGGGWVFGGNDYHVDFDDGSTQNVALRSISPIPVATPLLKVDTVDDPNGVPDSGHGGSIPPDDSAIGVSPSLDDDIEMEVNPLYIPFGGTLSTGTGSEARDHSYIGGDSDTISEGNEPVVAYPIRDVQFNSFGAGSRVTGEESVEL
ncbi:uncharacterized protein [Diadema setosum]|uniref:uncharacterized protein n=1 Tax=Diadema setosum TaxID=31175 RepID=UPI003B3B2351